MVYYFAGKIKESNDKKGEEEVNKKPFFYTFFRLNHLPLYIKRVRWVGK